MKLKIFYTGIVVVFAELIIFIFISCSNITFINQNSETRLIQVSNNNTLEYPEFSKKIKSICFSKEILIKGTNNSLDPDISNNVINISLIDILFKEKTLYEEETIHSQQIHEIDFNKEFKSIISEKIFSNIYFSNYIKEFQFNGQDRLQSQFLEPHPYCTIPSYAIFDIKPGKLNKQVMLITSEDTIFYLFGEEGGNFEIPDVDSNYMPIKIIIESGKAREVFDLTLFSERWMEVFLDSDVQCAVLWEGARPRMWTLVTTGKDNWTRAEHCNIISKQPVAYFVLDGAPMRWWLGIQKVYGTLNGTHAPLSGSWRRLGRQGSHGCIRNPFAEEFYAVLDTGDRVELHYKNSDGYEIQNINPAWRYVEYDLLDYITDTSSKYQYIEKAAYRLIPIYDSLLEKAWMEEKLLK